MSEQKLPPIHPGEILLEEFLKPMGISQYRIAKDISVPARRINEIVHGERGISPDTALRLSRYFGLSERFWINLQARYNLEVEKDRLKDRLDKEVRVYATAQ
ncbi:MAG: addiction module antidote protein, HigA family [Anaerolineales bacterium]|nr:MAG: addiction module antidote protein, HigA family [Anaerolineales bacterium]